MSISCAPSPATSCTSKTVTAGSPAPRGKPATQQAFTGLPANNSAQRGTQSGFTQTLANPMVQRLGAELANLLFAGLGLEERVVDEARQLRRGERSRGDIRRQGGQIDPADGSLNL